MNVAVSGASGFIGRALVNALRDEGHAVTTFHHPYSSLDFSGIDAVIHLGGAPVMARWTKRRKKMIFSSRVESTQGIVRAINQAGEVATFICASAIGIYGNVTGGIDEAVPAGTGFLASVCCEWEAASEMELAPEVRVAQVRTGLVLGRGGGVLKRLEPLFKVGLGGPLGDGQQMMSWIALEDEVRAIMFVLKHETLSGAVNLTAPQPESNQEFSEQFASVWGQKARFRVPSCLLLLVGGRAARELLLEGVCVLPKKLMDAGFEFCHPTLQLALEKNYEQKQ